MSEPEKKHGEPVYITAKSGYIGVGVANGEHVSRPWKAYVSYGGHHEHLGYYSDPESAARVHNSQSYRAWVETSIELSGGTNARMKELGLVGTRLRRLNFPEGLRPLPLRLAVVAVAIVFLGLADEPPQARHPPDEPVRFE